MLIQRGREHSLFTGDRIEPAGRFHAEGDRRRLLQPRPSGHRGVHIPARMRGSRDAHAIEIRDERGRRPLQLQHERRIDDVLAGCAPMDVMRGAGIDRFDLPGQLPNERNRQVPIRHRFCLERANVITVGMRGRLNRLHGLAGNDAQLRLDLRERGFDVEHRLQAIGGAKHRRRRSRRRPASRR